MEKQVKSVSKKGVKRGPYNKTAKQEAKEAVKKSAKVAKPTIVEVVMYSKPQRNPKKSRTTVAGVIDYTKNTISIHGARNNTSLGEVFKRRVGRQVAIGRAKAHPLLTVTFKKDHAREAFYEAANAIIKKPYRISEVN